MYSGNVRFAKIDPHEGIEPSVTPFMVIFSDALYLEFCVSALYLIIDMSAWVSTKKVHLRSATSHSNVTKSAKFKFKLKIDIEGGCRSLDRRKSHFLVASVPAGLATGPRSFPRI